MRGTSYLSTDSFDDRSCQSTTLILRVRSDQVRVVGVYLRLQEQVNLKSITDVDTREMNRGVNGASYLDSDRLIEKRVEMLRILSDSQCECGFRQSSRNDESKVDNSPSWSTTPWSPPTTSQKAHKTPTFAAPHFQSQQISSATDPTPCS